jgi:hypothetical protein
LFILVDWEIVELTEPADLDLGAITAREPLLIGFERDSLRPGDGFIFRRDINDPVTRDDLFRFGERSVRASALAAGHLQASSQLARMKSFGPDQRASLDQLLVIFPHCCDELRTRQLPCFCPLVALDHHHESHRSNSSNVERRMRRSPMSGVLHPCSCRLSSGTMRIRHRIHAMRG